MDEDTLITSSRGALRTLDAETLTLKKKYIHQTRANSVNKENQMIMLSSNTKKYDKGVHRETISSKSVVCFRQESANLSPSRHIL